MRSLVERFGFRFVLLALALAGAFVATARAAAPAGDDAEVARVIARYVKATGGAEAASREHSFYTHGTIEAFGFTGHVDTWGAQPGRHYSRIELGPFKLSEGSDGVTAWRTDPTTGRVVRLADRDSVEALESAWFELERWTQPGLGGGRAAVVAHERDGKDTYTVLAIVAPRGARAHRLYFSDATGLVAREEAQHDQSVVTTTFDDWRMAAGRVRAWTTRVSLANMPANQMAMHADSFAADVDLAGVPFTPPDSSGGNTLRWLGANGSVSLPFDYRARHVWLKASINGGPPQDFLFDTGASVTVLDSTFAVTHGVDANGYMQAAGAGASGSASFATLNSLAVTNPDGAGVELHELKVAVMNVNPMFARYFWGDLAGILGYDFISRFTTTIDYDRHVLVLNDPHQFTYKGTEAPLPMKLNGVVPSVVATLDGRYTGDFRLDVGSSSTVDLHGPFGRAHHIERQLHQAREATGAGFGGEFVSVLGRLHRMSIGPYEWKDPLVTVARATEGAFASEDFAGNIGNRLLERFRVTLDYEHHKVWLEPGERYTQRDAFTRTGLLLGWAPDHIEALAVLPGSPAERAGLREGDRVTAIAGRSVSSYSLENIDSVLEGGPDGRRIPLTVDRGGREVGVTLVVHEMVR